MSRNISSLFITISEVENIRNVSILLEKILLDKITLTEEEQKKFQEIMDIVEELENKVYELDEM